MKTLRFFFLNTRIRGPVILINSSSIIRRSGKGVKKILVEHYFSDSAAKKVAYQLKNMLVKHTPVAVLATPKIKTIDDLFEEIVSKIEENS